MNCITSEGRKMLRYGTSQKGQYINLDNVDGMDAETYLCDKWLKNIVGISDPIRRQQYYPEKLNKRLRIVRSFDPVFKKVEKIPYPEGYMTIYDNWKEVHDSVTVNDSDKSVIFNSENRRLEKLRRKRDIYEEEIKQSYVGTDLVASIPSKRKNESNATTSNSHTSTAPSISTKRYRTTDLKEKGPMKYHYVRKAYNKS